MQTRDLLVTSSFVLLAGFAACDDTPTDPTGTLDVTFALTGIDPDVRYLKITVSTDSGDTIARADAEVRDADGALVADPALTVVCEPGDSYTVTVWGSEAKVCSTILWNVEREVACAPGATPVALAGEELRMGFAECAEPELELPFCSAKIDSDVLLHDPRTHERGPTSFAVVACAAENELYVYATDARVTCGEATMTFPVASAELGDSDAIAPYIALAAKFAGTEDLGDPLKKYFLNVAFLIDLAALDGGSCTLDLVVAMSDTPLDAETVPALFDGKIIGVVFDGALVTDGELVVNDPSAPGWHAVGYEDLIGAPLAPVAIPESL